MGAFDALIRARTHDVADSIDGDAKNGPRMLAMGS
jgi:hypothetical protein